MALVGAGIHWSYHTLNFERTLVLSNVLCNRAKSTEGSMGLFVSLFSPFIVVAGFVAVVQLPGVLDVSGGLLKLLEKLAKKG